MPRNFTTISRLSRETILGNLSNIDLFESFLINHQTRPEAIGVMRGRLNGFKTMLKNATAPLNPMQLQRLDQLVGKHGPNWLRQGDEPIGEDDLTGIKTEVDDWMGDGSFEAIIDSFSMDEVLGLLLLA